MEITIKINGQALSVEVSVEVYEYIDRADHKEENLAHEKRRHWDIREFDEYIAAAEGHRYQKTPEEQVCRMETWDELLSVLESCTGTQRRRFLLYALEHSKSPEKILLEREEQAARQRLLSALPEAFSRATPLQARRVHAYYIADSLQREIAGREGVDNSKVCTAIRRGLQNMRRYYDACQCAE